jgi:3'(2'), 5'-bisphosphate nucleotidase
VFEVERERAIEAVREAAILCRAVQQGIEPGTLAKADASPVTVADYGSQALVCRALKEAFPADPIVAEEDSAALRAEANAAALAGVIREVGMLYPACGRDSVCGWIDYGGHREQCDRFWTLDPIDGTKGFLRGEQYAVALALIVDGEVVVAALACPNLDLHSEGAGVIFSAVRGEGAIVQPLDGSRAAREARVSKTVEPAQARFCESYEAAHSDHGEAAEIASRLGITAASVRMDSQAKYGVLAAGGADIYLRLPTRPGYVEKIWDHAAGVLVIEEAGGKVTDITGKPLAFRHGSGLEENRGVVATNGVLHDRVLEAIQAG